MHTFFLDLWADLRAKRLWPVAVLLLAGIVAVPFVLRADEQPAPPPATPPAPAQTAADRLPTIALEDASSYSPSKLSEFRQRNPFKPLNDLPEATDGPSTGENETVDLGKSPDQEKADKGGAPGLGGGSPSAKGGAGNSGGSAPAKGGAGGSSGGTGSGAGSYVGPRTTYYAYRADLRFGPADKAKAMKQVAAFTLLGDKDEPAAMFMGITDDHKYAVFAVDTARYESDGEHSCKPSPERCEFVYLKVAENGNETTFTTLDGQTSYDLKLDAIKRVALDKKDVESVPTEDAKPDAAPAGKAKVVDAEPRSLFDILAKRR